MSRSSTHHGGRGSMSDWRPQVPTRRAETARLRLWVPRVGCGARTAGGCPLLGRKTEARRSAAAAGG